MRLLITIAHPDDESFGCGSVLARASAAGDETTVLCATRGEAGESRLPIDDLAALREEELRAAARILGVGAVHLLDYVDSGMTGNPEPDMLVAAEPCRIASELRSVIDDVRPDVVVTLDASDGHRDHAIIRDATLSAVDTSHHRPAATYLWCLARSSMARWVVHRRGASDDAYLSLGELGTPDEDITTVVDVTAHLPKLGGDPGPRQPDQPV